jgi:hypothetical protein
MKNKHKSLLSVIAIACAVGVPLSLTTAHELPVQAALSAPASYDINYQYSSTTGTWHLGNTSAGSGLNDRMIYTRTTDSTYFNYTSTATSTTHSHRLPLGFSITNTFNRSNTSWTSMVGGYRPTESKIGSDNTVGSVANKMSLIFDNQTNNDYFLYLDLTSIGSWNDRNFVVKYDNKQITDGYFGLLLVHIADATNFIRLPIQSKYNVEISSYDTSASIYFDAFYLEDLGVSDAFGQGFNDGFYLGEIAGLEDSNILIGAFESIVGMMVNFTFIIFSLEIFGVSMLSIVGVLFGIIAITWILKTIRG